MDRLARRLMKIAEEIVQRNHAIREDDDSFSVAEKAIKEFLSYISKTSNLLWELFERFGYSSQVNELIEKVQSYYNDDDFHCVGIFKSLSEVLDKVSERIDEEITDDKEWEMAYDVINSFMNEVGAARDACDIYDSSKYYRVELSIGGMASPELFEVEASDAQNALEGAVALAEKNELEGLLNSPADIEKMSEDEKEDYIYVDASSYGASHPWYIRSDLVNIQEI